MYEPHAPFHAKRHWSCVRKTSTSAVERAVRRWHREGVGLCWRPPLDGIGMLCNEVSCVGAGTRVCWVRWAVGLTHPVGRTGDFPCSCALTVN